LGDELGEAIGAIWLSERGGFTDVESAIGVEVEENTDVFECGFGALSNGVRIGVGPDGSGDGSGLVFEVTGENGAAQREGDVDAVGVAAIGVGKEKVGRR